MKISTPSMQELLEAGVHFGHQVRRGHPKMGEYIFGAREGVHIINLEYSDKLLKEAAQFAYELGKNGKVLLFVGTKKQAQPIVKDLALKFNAPYVNYRWVGGLLTNFDEIRKNVKKLTELQGKKEKGELTHYTKKEQLLISRKLDKFDNEWGGIVKMDKLPDALFVVDCVAEKTALAEGNRLNLPIIGIADSNCNPALLSYPIPGNDDATKSIKILAEAVAKAYGEGISGTQNKEESKKEAAKKEEIVKIEDEVVKDEVAAAEEKVEKETVEESKREV